MITSSQFLRRALAADAVFSGVAAIMLSAGASQLAPLLQLPEALLRETGLFLIAYTVLVGWLASRASAPRALVGLVIAGNAAWTVGSIALLFSGTVAPNVLGEIFELPDEVKSSLRRVMDSFGLNFASLDMIVTPDGEFVFLELNPNGQWLWLELELGLPLVATMADLLTSNVRAAEDVKGALSAS